MTDATVMSVPSIIYGHNNRSELIAALNVLEATAGLSQTHKYQLLNALEKLAQRYHRNRSWQVNKKANEQNLLLVRNDLIKGRQVHNYRINALILVRLALSGYQPGSPKHLITKSFKKAKASLPKVGRKPQVAEKILITKLCLLYLDLFGELPPVRAKKQNKTLGNSYYGKGLDFVVSLFQALTQKNYVADNTLGHYLFSEVKRLSPYVADYIKEKTIIK